MTEQARKQANLRLLQRTVDPTVVDIVQTATHVVLYEYLEGAWTKSGVEGSLFLANSTTTYQLIILNRNSTQNFQMLLNGTVQMQHDDPFLILKEKTEAASRIRGIWFHNADERVSMADVLQQTLNGLVQGTLSVAAPVHVAPPASYAAAAAPLAVVDSSAALAALLGVTSISGTAAVAVAQAAPVAAVAVAAPQPQQVENAPPVPAGIALDKKSLQLALLSLIQDDRFLDLVHSQYLRVAQARAKKSNGAS